MKQSEGWNLDEKTKNTRGKRRYVFQRPKLVSSSSSNTSFASKTKKRANLFWSGIVLVSSVGLGVTLSATPAHAGCATSKGIARISDRETGKKIQQLKHVQIYECGNSWSSLEGKMTGQTKTGWMKCTKIAQEA